MIITKDELQNIVNILPDKADVEDVFDKILISAKIEQAIKESDEGLGQDWDEFKQQWLKEDL